MRVRAAVYRLGHLIALLSELAGELKDGAYRRCCSVEGDARLGVLVPEPEGGAHWLAHPRPLAFVVVLALARCALLVRAEKEDLSPRRVLRFFLRGFNAPSDFIGEMGVSCVMGANKSLDVPIGNALRRCKVKRASHPLRARAVQMILRGEATPAEIRQALQVSRQLVYYWCRCAGIVGKSGEARKAYIWRELLKGAKAPIGPEPEHPDIRALRARLNRPRPSREQLNAARQRHAQDT